MADSRDPFGQPAIRLQGVSKCYQLYPAPAARLRQLIMPGLQRVLGRPARQLLQEFWALKALCLEIREGETIGVVGRNGSGKSTLLQLIAGTLAPTSGSIAVNGRIGALLELGSGFNPEFSGRENVYLNAALLGLSKEQIDARFNDIAEFAEIGDFIDQPVRTYSSGMAVRLAFAVSAFVTPDILIIDEALAVGDAAFQAKCMLALRRFQEAGGTVLFASHDVNAVRALCRRAIYLEQGVVRADGDAGDVCALYLRDLQAITNQHLAAASHFVKEADLEPTVDYSRGSAKPSPAVLRDFAVRTAHCRHGAGGARVLFAELTDLEGGRIESASFDQPVRIRMLVEGHQPCRLSVNFRLCDKHQMFILGGDFLAEKHELLEVDVGTLHWVSYETRLPLMDGHYTLRISLTQPIDQHREAVFVEIVEIAQVFSVRAPEHVKLWTAVHLPSTLTVQQVAADGLAGREVR